MENAAARGNNGNRGIFRQFFRDFRYFRARRRFRRIVTEPRPKNMSQTKSPAPAVEHFNNFGWRYIRVTIWRFTLPALSTFLA
ncbi:MAG TPA: hypothetical protein VKE91_09180 [Blastocatellia bacterium]|nr:hypothetical protein [Blastocatellia bacterium]